MRIVIFWRSARICSSVFNQFILWAAVEIIEQAKRRSHDFYRRYDKLIARWAEVREKVRVSLERVSLTTNQSH